jgi:divalent metal cation (Fe/Co/Zn/Cd) transporter
MGMKSVRELTDASIEHDMLNYMEKLIRNVEGVVEARKIRYPRRAAAAVVLWATHLCVSATHLCVSAIGRERWGRTASWM